MPQKMTFRYSRIMGHTSSGTRRKPLIPSSARKVRRFSTTVSTPIRTKEAQMLSFSRFSSR